MIPRNPIFNVYLHHFLRSDDDRALHDHPWVNLSFLLSGQYWQHRETGAIRWRTTGDIVVRRATAAHRIELPRVAGNDIAVWTLFITGPRIREWGFLCPKGWRHWRDFTANDGRTVGRGCD